MSKLSIPKLVDPGDGTIHYQADGLSGNVTLCGTTDWIDEGVAAAEEAEKDVDCVACRSIVNFVLSHVKGRKK